MSYQNRRRKDEDHDLESRVSSVETAIDHIESTIVEVRDSIKIGFSEIKHEIEIQEQYSKPRMAQWAGWAAVLLLVIGMFSSGYIRDLSRIEIEHNKVKAHVIDLLIKEERDSTRIKQLMEEVYGD